MRALWALAFCALLAREGSAELRSTLSLQHDDNLFETRHSKRQGWVNRLFIEMAEELVVRNWGRVYWRHQSGFKRLWQARERGGLAGEVMANHVALGGALRLGEQWTATWQTDGKLVNAQNLSHEQSYLRGGLRATVERRLGAAAHVGAHYGVGRDDMRDLDAADVTTREVGVGGRYGYGRFKGRLSLTWRRLAVDREIVGFAGVSKWRDRMLEGQWGVRYYRRALVDLNYTLLQNRSNAAANRFRAHRLQFLLAGALVAKIDGQIYWTLQQRRYEELAILAPRAVSDDEYAQNLLSLKMSRPLSEHYGLSVQWWHARNGSRQTAAFYRKNTLSLLLDMAL